MGNTCKNRGLEGTILFILCKYASKLKNKTVSIIQGAVISVRLVTPCFLKEKS
jgi:hypothetical protein